MYYSLNIDTLGISGRQSELIELALTYKFHGIDVELETISRRETLESLSGVRQMFDSAKLGRDGFSLPIGWRAEKPQYEQQKSGLKHLLDIAQGLGMSYAAAKISPDTHLPFPEDFELHQTRIREVADLLAPRDLRLGLCMQAAAAHRAGCDSPFVHQAETFTTLVNTVAHPQVGMVLDTWDWVVGGGTVAMLKDVPVEKILAVRLAGLPAGVELELAQETDRVIPEQDSQVDNGQFLAALNEMGYQGSVAVWPHPSHLASESRDDAAKRAKEALDQLWIDSGMAPGPPMAEEQVAAEDGQPIS